MKSLVTILVRGFLASTADEPRGRRSRVRLRRQRDVGCERLEDRTLMSVNPAGWSERPVPAPAPFAPPANQALALVASPSASARTSAVRAAPPRLAVSVPDVVDRGSPAVFTVTLSQPAGPGGVTVNYTTKDIRARAGVDYTARRGTVRFAPGEIVKTFSVPTLVSSPPQDRAVNFQAILSSPANAKLVGNTATTRIVDPLPTVASSPFAINVVFPDNSLTYSQQRVFTLAAQRWSQIITADLPDIEWEGRTIDDVEITASAVRIDGVGGILGQATWTQLRPIPAGTPANAPNRQTPFLGFMQFDTTDVTMMMGTGTFQSVVLHEMGHVLGIGSLWQLKRLVTGVGGANPVYTGANGVAEYNKLLAFGGATSVPVENLGGPGTAGAHWRESVFDNELMTGIAEKGGVKMPISRLTVGSLEDLGYTVDYAAADPYLLSSRVGGTGPMRAVPPASGYAGNWLVAAAGPAELAWGAITVNVGEAAAKPRPIVPQRG